MIIVIVGPTGVGKTKLSVELAKRLNGEIINGDSTQVYCGLNIATAKIKESEKEEIPHHLFDIKNITEDYTVYDYQIDARKAIDDILGRKKTPIIVGGTGLYIKSALYNYDFETETKHNDYSSYSNEELYQKALEIDPKLSIHMNNRKRIERFLDYYLNNNKSLSEKEKSDELVYQDVIFIGLTTSRDVLYNRLNDRVDQMFKEGLLEEAKKLYESKINTKAVLTPIGYKELFPYFDNKEKLSSCIEVMKKRTRNYAKRQYTWFNHQIKVNWFDVNFNDFNETINQIYEFIKRTNQK